LKFWQTARGLGFVSETSENTLQIKEPQSYSYDPFMYPPDAPTGWVSSKDLGGFFSGFGFALERIG